MPIQNAYVHFHPPPRGGYYTLFRFLDEVYNSASYMGGIIFFKRFISIILQRYQLTDDILQNVSGSYLYAYVFQDPMMS